MCTLWLIRKGRALRRKIFGKKLPHWAKDFVGLIKYINFLRLLPTIHMIICAPGHFFHTLPTILNGKKGYYVSPSQFVFNVATLQITLIALVFPENGAISKEAAIAVNFAAAFLSPILIAVTCAVVLFLYFASVLTWPANKLARDLPINYHALLIPLDPSTYTVLNWSRYLWSLLYFYLYFYVMFLLISVPFVVLEIFLWDVYRSVANRIYFNWLTIAPFTIIAFIAAIFGYWICIRPYILLLVSSSRRATRTMRLYAMEIHDYLG